MSLVLHGTNGITFPSGNEIAVADLKDGTDGELITWDASGNPAAVAVGNASEVLTSGGVGVAPTFQAAATGGWAFIQSQDASSDATIDFTGFDDASYDAYLLVLINVIPVTDNVSAMVRTSTDGGVGFDAGASDYAWSIVHQDDGGTLAADTDAADGAMDLRGDAASSQIGSAAGEYGMSGTVWIFGPGLANDTHFKWEVMYESSSASAVPNTTRGGGYRISAADVDAIQFLFSSGNVESGTLNLYGIKNA